MNHYFVTGATGNIGAALVEKLLRRDADEVIELLIRARDDAHLRERFDDLCSFWEIPPEDALRKVILCRGDMTEPHFGLDATAYDRLSRHCTHIIHCGGVVRMNLPLEEARKAAVGAAREVVELGLNAKQSGCLKKIDFVSTVGVIGKLNMPLTERLITEPREFHNTYEQAKAEAEEFLYDYMVDGRLPITVHRPSMVVGDSVTGKALSYQVFYHLCEFISGKRTLGILPDLKNVKLDIIPVDYVVEVVEWALNSAESVGRFMHECSGVNDSLCIGELERQLASYPYFIRKKSASHNVKIHLPHAVFKVMIRVVDFLLTEENRKVLRTLPYFLNYMEDPQIFDDQGTKELLSNTIKKPLPGDYIKQLLDAYTKQKDNALHC